MPKCPDLDKLRILHYPDAKLREHARQIKEIDSFLAEITERMTELMQEANGVGLAATQVGWPFRFIVLNPTQKAAHVQAFINPAIIAREGEAIREEGCLSVPGVFANLKRAQKVRVRATLPDGEQVEMDAEDLAARAWQHELDHLDGGLFVDRLRPSAKIVVSRRLRELERRYQEESAAESDEDA